MAYTNQANVENYLKRELTENELNLMGAVLLDAVKTYIDEYTGSTFDEGSSASRYYDGDGSQIVDIDPCTAITAVALVDQDYAVTDTLTSPDEYVAEPVNETVKRYLRIRHHRLSHRLHYVKVTATFGEYDDGIPTDIQYVATRLIAAMLSSAETNSGIKSESLEGHSVTYDLESIARSTPTILDTLNHRRTLLVA